MKLFWQLQSFQTVLWVCSLKHINYNFFLSPDKEKQEVWTINGQTTSLSFIFYLLFHKFILFSSL